MLVAGDSPELLSYAAMLAACSVNPSVAFAGAAATVPELFEIARESRADLIVVRRPRSRVLIRHLVCLAPCPVLLLPDGAASSVARPLVRLSLTSRGARLLALAAAVTRHAGGGELIAAHNVFDYEVDEQPDLAERFRTSHELAIYRFLARADLSGVCCTPVRASAPSESGTLLELARRREADLIVMDPAADGGPVWQWNRREARRLAERSPVPVLAAGAGEASWATLLRDQVFTEMEPKFN